MNFRQFSGRVAAICCLGGLPVASAAAQVETVQRIAGMVAIAVDEYGKAVDGRGKLVSVEEYNEAVGFLSEARGAAGRLPTDRRAATEILDSVIPAVNGKPPPADVQEIAKRFGAALGSAAALDLPKGPLDPDAGRAVYAA